MKQLIPGELWAIIFYLGTVMMIAMARPDGLELIWVDLWGRAHKYMACDATLLNKAINTAVLRH